VYIDRKNNSLQLFTAPAFDFGGNFIFEERTALRHTDVFINCSVDPNDTPTLWYFEDIDTHISDLNKTDKYQYIQNISGLTIHNVTEKNQGHYICILGQGEPINATILLKVVCELLNTNFMHIRTYIIALLGSPELFLPQNMTIEVNISEEVILNCSASSSPDPVYSWNISDSCSSCPNFSNDSIIIFTADISNSGDYICVAENDYGNTTKYITINVICKLINTYSYIHKYSYIKIILINTLQVLT